MEKVIAVVAALLLIGCEDPPAPKVAPAPPPRASAEERAAVEKLIEDGRRLAVLAKEAQAALGECASENDLLIKRTKEAKAEGSGGLTAVTSAAGAHYLIEYIGNDCGGLPRHIMRIERQPGDWKWIGLTCTTKFTDKWEDVGFECQGNNDKITARKTAWDTFEGVESRSPSTVFKGTPLAAKCTGAWGIKATLITHVPNHVRRSTE